MSTGKVLGAKEAAAQRQSPAGGTGGCQRCKHHRKQLLQQAAPLALEPSQGC